MTVSVKNMAAKTLRQWLAHDPFTLSASAAYYAVFSMPGLMITLVALAALFFDQQTIEKQIVDHIKGVLGSGMADIVRSMIDNTRQGNRDFWGVIVGTVTLLSGAMGLFIQLQHALNSIWEVEVRKKISLLTFLKDRATALGVMIAICFLLLVSLTLTSLLAAFSDRLAGSLPVYMVAVFHIADFALSLIVISFLFALMFKVLPDVHLKWRYTLIGGLVSAFLFTAGEYGLSLYFGLAKPQSLFGAAGSIILLMIWVYYSCLIFLLGAEFTKIHADARQQPVEPTAIAQKKDKAMDPRQERYPAAPVQSGRGSHDAPPHPPLQ